MNVTLQGFNMHPFLTPRGKLLSLLCLLYLVVVGILGQKNASISPSIHYIAAQIPFFYAPNITIATNEAYVTSILNSSCQCRSACISWLQAQACSDVPLNSGKVECRFSFTPPTNHTTENLTGANYYYKKDSLDGEVYFMADRLMYFKSRVTKNFTEAVAFCRKIPGFRLAIFKYARQMLVVNEVMKWGQFYIHLEKTPNGLKWGDDTLYKDTELPSNLIDVTDNKEIIFRIADKGFMDQYPTYAYGVLCQANPLGEPW